MLRRFFNGLVSRKTTRSAIEIGDNEIRFVSLRPTSTKIEADEILRMPLPSGFSWHTLDRDNVIDETRRITAEFNLAGKKVVSCLGGSNVVTRHTRIPVLAGKELHRLALAEANKIIPISLDEMVLRYTILGKTLVNGDYYYNVLIAAASRSIIFNYHNLLKSCEVQLVALDLPTIALWRLFYRETQSGETIAVVNVSPSEIIVVICEHGQLIFSRTISMNTRGMAGLKVFRERILTEIRQSIDFHRGAGNYKLPGRIILSGDVHYINELAPLLQNETGIDTGVHVPVRLGENFPAYEPSLALAIGLALRGVKNCAGN